LASEYIIDTAKDVNTCNKHGLSPILAAIIPDEDTATANYSRKADAVEYLVSCFAVVFVTF